MSVITIKNLYGVFVAMIVAAFMISCAPAPRMDWAAVADYVVPDDDVVVQKQPVQKQPMKKGSN